MASLCLSLHQTLSPIRAIPIANPTLSFPRSNVAFIRPSTRRATAAAPPRASYNPTPATERVISIASYALPFFNSLQYGRFLFVQYPRLGLLFDPLVPILNLYRSVPYASFVAFFGLYLGVVRNTRFSRYVRFNAMQAVTLDVLLAVPVLLTRILDLGRGGFGVRAVIWGHNAVFVFSCLCFVYGVLSCIVGKTPYLPLVADAAGRQL
ncbi:PREDICTED: protein TIC 20-II, chloroplastic [Tarenaya hassleriana]|uniref:protein TIC 20-II, chloroplastic n=1 Tax=Tarenaya hassleriana TaxID=28532 RepID=UPI00053C7BED|nr:PREDICTED: protein TIC 20-II, chloroplastic [Tarenaya hassleriana]